MPKEIVKLILKDVAVFWNLYQGHYRGQMRHFSLRIYVTFKEKNNINVKFPDCERIRLKSNSRVLMRG